MGFFIYGIGVFTYAILEGLEGGRNHVKNESLVLSNEENMEYAFSFLARPMDDIVIMDDNGKQNFLSVDRARISGFDVIKKNSKDSLVRLDYVEQTYEGDGQHIEQEHYIGHKDVVLMPNSDIRKLKKRLYISAINDITDISFPKHDQNMTDDIRQNNIIRLDSLVN